MPAPFSSPCLRVLLAEVNARWPGRDRTSDGWLGDAAHAARPSDHNPDPDGSVDARDIDKDGIDTNVLIAALWRDPRVSYLIFDGRWAGVATGWQWRTYAGANPHRGHVHVSCLEARQNDTRPWGIAAARVSNPGANVPTAPAAAAAAQTPSAPALAHEEDPDMRDTVRYAYRRFLGREPAESEYDVHLGALVQGQATLLSIRQSIARSAEAWSAEARARRVAINPAWRDLHVPEV